MDDPSSSLVCQENETRLEEGDEEYSIIQTQQYSGVSEEEDLGVLVEREILLGFQKDAPMVFEDWIKRARKDAINWILKTRTALGFHFHTAYLSVAYLDRFLSRRSIDSEKYWAIQLLSVACLSLAAKMEECSVPCLPEFQLEDYCFESRVILRMELLVLTTLEWNMSIITPFSFLPYFITKFLNEPPPPSPNFSKTMQQLIFTTMKEVNLMDHKPSVIAAAATLAALDQQLTMELVELKIRSIAQYNFLDPRDIFVCYNLIQKLYEEETRRDNVVHTPNPSFPIQYRPVNMTDSSLVSSAATSKRRRLTFNNDDSDEGNGLH